MPVRQRLNCGDGIAADLIAIFTHAAQQCFPSGAKGAVLPAGVLLSWIALFPLQPPLERIVHDSPVRVELRYEAI